MSTPQEKLASSLDILHRLQSEGRTAIQSAALTRIHRDRLAKNGFLLEVVKGWWIPSHPHSRPGDTTAWYASYWGFVAQFLDHRFGAGWHLAPDQSLRLHVGNRTVPRKLIVHSPKASNNLLALPCDTSLLDIRQAVPATPQGVVGLSVDDTQVRVLALPVALVRASPAFFTEDPINAQIALSRVRDASELLAPLLAGGHSAVAGRLAGAMRAIGDARIANDIVATMKAAGYVVTESNPFDQISRANLFLQVEVKRLRGHSPAPCCSTYRPMVSLGSSPQETMQ